MKPIFCGNLEYDARPSELERLFKRYGKVERVDVKSGIYIFWLKGSACMSSLNLCIDVTVFCCLYFFCYGDLPSHIYFST